jgi:hypothetical protein
MLAAGNTKMHKQQAEAAMMEAQTHRMEYELHLKEYQAAHPAPTYHKVNPHKKG